MWVIWWGLLGGVHRGVQQNVDYNFFNHSVYIYNQFLGEIDIYKESFKSTIYNSNYKSSIISILWSVLVQKLVPLV